MAGRMAVKVLAYLVEGEIRVKSRHMAGVQASGRSARGGGPCAGGGARNAELVSIPGAGFMGIHANPSPQPLAPDPARFQDLLETKGVRCLAPECLNALCPSNKET